MKKSLVFCIIFITCIVTILGAKPLTKKLPETLRLEDLTKQAEVIVIADFSSQTYGKKLFRGHDLVWKIREFTSVEVLKGKIDTNFIFAEAQVKKSTLPNSYKVNYEEGDRVLLFLHKDEDFTYRTIDENKITKRKLNVIDNRSIIRVTKNNDSRELDRINKLFQLSIKSFGELQKKIKSLIQTKEKL